MLTRFQRMILRGWATNMVVAFRFLGWRRNGFNYTNAEQARLRAIVADRSSAAFAAWLVLAAVLLMGAVVPLIGVVLTHLPKSMSMLGLPAIVLGAFIIAPLAIGFGSAITDVMFRAPPFVEADGDAALYGKFQTQLLMIGGGAIVVALVLAWWGG